MYTITIQRRNPAKRNRTMIIVLTISAAILGTLVGLGLLYYLKDSSENEVTETYGDLFRAGKI
jgi:hypothetical protein